MTRTQGILAILAAGFVAAWGCGQSPPPAAGAKSLETRVAKLEQELKSALEARDSARLQVVELERKWKAEQTRVQGIEKERDEARVSLKTRTTELDAATARFQSLHKGLKELVGQMDMTATPTTIPSPATVQTLPNPNGY